MEGIPPIVPCEITSNQPTNQPLTLRPKKDSEYFHFSNIFKELFFKNEIKVRNESKRSENEYFSLAHSFKFRLTSLVLIYN